MISSLPKSLGGDEYTPTSDDWEVLPIKRLAAEGAETFTDGDWIESPYITDSGIRLIQTGNIGVGEFIDKGDRYISEETFNELDCTEVFPGDILISRLADPVGRACIAPDLNSRMIASVDVVVLRTRDQVDNRYLVNLLSSPTYLEYADSLCRGGTMERLSRRMLGEIEIALPSHETQANIADILQDKLGHLNSLIKKYGDMKVDIREKKALEITSKVLGGAALKEDTRPLGQRVDELTPKNWDTSKLAWVTSKIGSGTTPEGGSESYVDSGIPFIRSQNVTEEGLDAEEIVFIDQQTHTEMGATALESGDVLLNITGASIGRNAIVPDRFPPGNVNQHVCIIRPNQNHILPDYLNYLIYSDVIQSQIDSNMTGASRQAITTSQLSSFKVPVPSKEDQRDIIKNLESSVEIYHDVIDEINGQMSLLEEKRQALITAAVTGQIDVAESDAAVQ